jgi:uncharacterized protein
MVLRFNRIFISYFTVMNKFLITCCMLLSYSFIICTPLQDSNYKESPIVLHTSSGDIFGTLTMPQTKSVIPIALIIAGSGPTDRNGNNPMMKNESLHKLAMALADSEIASLRYDKRAIGESKAAAKSEVDLRFNDYVKDAKDWIGLLRKDTRFSKVIVIGHSEGSLIGMIAANNADGYVSIAGAGRPADKILKEQLDKQPQAVKDLSFPIIDSLVTGKTVSNVNPMLFSLFRPSVQPYMISWFRYDPSVEIKKLKIPVLIIQGTNDIQVTLQDASMLAKANGTAQLVEIKNMNHIFRIVEGDRNANIATYNDASLPIAGELSNSIVSFIRKLKQ